jgi:hypothetical protein
MQKWRKIFSEKLPIYKNFLVKSILFPIYRRKWLCDGSLANQMFYSQWEFNFKEKS